MKEEGQDLNKSTVSEDGTISTLLRAHKEDKLNHFEQGQRETPSVPNLFEPTAKTRVQFGRVTVRLDHLLFPCTFSVRRSPIIESDRKAFQILFSAPYLNAFPFRVPSQCF